MTSLIYKIKPIIFAKRDVVRIPLPIRKNVYTHKKKTPINYLLRSA